MSTATGKPPNLPPAQQAIKDRCYHPTGAFLEFKEEDTEQFIPERFEEQVRLFPNRLAVKTKDQDLTYETLNQESNRIARALLDQLGGGSEPVVLLFEQGIQGIAALLGVMKAGKFFVLVDPSFPRGRIEQILENSQATFIITNDQNLPQSKGLTTRGIGLLNVEQIETDLPAKNLELYLSSDAISYLVYTSGSTGSPKGVVQTHRTVMHHIKNRTNDFHICAEDRWGLLSTSSAITIFNVLNALLNGAALYPFDIREKGVAPLASWLNEQEITMLYISSPVYRNFIDTLSGEEEFPCLRLIRLASQAPSISDVGSYKRHFSRDCVLVNGLACSEVGILANYFMDKDSLLTGSTVPVGYPPDDLEVVILDDEEQEMGFDQVGEIAVKSQFVSTGYWQKSDMTEASFRPDPSGGCRRIYLNGDLGLMRTDGCLEHLGRKDFRTKIRGYSVELAEVEAALLHVHTIKEAVVVASGESEGYTRLVAYIVPRGKSAPNTSRLIRDLRKSLPDYMIPSAFVVLDSLPLLPGGKVDRQALPTPSGARPELETPFLAPRTLFERELAGIWAKVLRLELVGINDNFLELGGDSLLAGRVISRVIETWKVELPLRSLFESPTVANMAAVIEQSETERAGQVDVEAMLAQVEALSDEEVRSVRRNEC